ncbi:MAG: histidine phosphatase family protein [Planctomycetes bacterium]|nr:histidine phosphatase family protein [Planctomycetota bacterium]
MQIILIRHAQTLGNYHNNYSIENYDHLSEIGRQQAQKLAELLKDRDLGSIFVSPHIRTVGTAIPILKAKNVKAQIWPELAEGCWQEVREPMADDCMMATTTIPADYTPWFGVSGAEVPLPHWQEGFARALKRVAVVIDRLYAMIDSTERVTLVTHGLWLREFLNLLLGTSRFSNFDHDNCGMTDIELTRDIVLVRYLNRNPF